MDENNGEHLEQDGVSQPALMLLWFRPITTFSALLSFLGDYIMLPFSPTLVLACSSDGNKAWEFRACFPILARGLFLFKTRACYLDITMDLTRLLCSFILQGALPCIKARRFAKWILSILLDLPRLSPLSACSATSLIIDTRRQSWHTAQLLHLT
ncbi:hypothetical protein BDZ89DRAFT_128403 [Hymenopellis radicata]|nr:hypothetical protein BDZ89DRAFT_128403 [Hymenopellis radicata]